jgi:predicted DNA-binding protein (UPF0251 family)
MFISGMFHIIYIMESSIFYLSTFVIMVISESNTPWTPLTPVKRWRKKKHRSINYTPQLTIREPHDYHSNTLPVRLYHDELESLRLKYINKLGIITWAKQMKISKSLFAKILQDAIAKVAHALIYWKRLEIELSVDWEQGPGLPL